MPNYILPFKLIILNVVYLNPELELRNWSFVAMWTILKWKHPTSNNIHIHDNKTGVILSIIHWRSDGFSSLQHNLDFESVYKEPRVSFPFREYYMQRTNNHWTCNGIL